MTLQRAPLVTLRGIHRPGETSRDLQAAASAVAWYEARFREIDGDLRMLRAGGWPETAIAELQGFAEITYRAARAERRAMEEAT